MRFVLASAILIALAGPTLADEFLANGDFEQAIDVGWRETTNVLAGTHSFDRWDTLGQPSPGYAARVYKYLGFYASLSQTVDVPDANLLLSFDGRFVIGGGTSISWPVASFWVRYLNEAGVELGNTRLYLPSIYATWASSETVSLHKVEGDGVWHNYSINIAQELAENLPGVATADVRKVRLDVFAYDSHSCGDGWAEVCVDNISLTAAGIEADRPVTVKNSGFAAFPNPFTGSTEVRFSSPLSSRSPISLYDAAGSLVRTLPAGNSRTLDGSRLKAGVYILRAGNQHLRLVKAAG